MEKNKSFLFLSSFLLLLFGFLILESASAPISLINFGHPFYYFLHQVLFGLLPGIIVGFLLSRFSLEKIKKLSPLILLLNLVFLIFVFLPWTGLKIKGGARWLKIGKFSFQPSEFLKLSFILYLASWLEGRRKRGEKDFSQTFFFFLLILIFISLFLILQPDISTLGIIFAIAVSLFFLAKTPIWQTLLLIFLGTLSLFPLVKIAPYRMRRILSFLNPELDPLGISYHSKQAKIAIGSGGIFGKGLAFSQEKFGLLPHSFSDSIFAVFAEETGFLGCFFLLSLYFLFFWQIFSLGKKQKNLFLKLLCFGILTWIFTQTFVNIGSMIGILPMTGIPLPFVSYGGSHLMAEIISLFLLFKINAKKEKI